MPVRWGDGEVSRWGHRQKRANGDPPGLVGACEMGDPKTDEEVDDPLDEFEHPPSVGELSAFDFNNSLRISISPACCVFTLSAILKIAFTITQTSN